MSANTSKASSFDYLDFYKQITRCIAKKNNVKVDLSKIPGAQQKRPKNSKPLITTQHLQAKFLAKYNAQKKAPTTEEQTIPARIPTAKNATQGNNKTIKSFVVKAPAGGTRKKEQPCYINLHPSFFNSFDGHDMSIFKVPELPPLKKTLKDSEPLAMQSNFLTSTLTKQFKEPEPPSSAAMSNTSLTSAMFNPKPTKTSTPIEKPKPFISDPSDIQSLMRSYTEVPSVVATPEETLLNIKAKNYLTLVDNVAKKIDEKGFSDMEDPLVEIRARVLEIYNCSTRYPRLINETLMSDNLVEDNKASKSVQTPLLDLPKKPLPIPQFYEKNANEKIETQSSLDRTKDIFSWTAKTNTIFNVETTPQSQLPPGISQRSLNRFFTPELLEMEQEMPIGANAVDILFSSPEITSPEAMELEDHVNHNNAFSFFTTDIAKDWQMPDLRCLDSTAAVFSSPPDSRPSQSHSRRSRHSQRSQRKSQIDKFKEESGNHSLATYQWTPNVGNFAFSNESTSSSRLFSFEPRFFF